MPTIPTLTYAATLYKATESPEYEKFVEGAKATNSDNLIFSFQRPEDTSGTFTLEVFAFVKADVEAEDGTKSFSRAGALFSGGKDGLAIEGDEIQVSDPIALSSSKSGTVNLQVTVPEGCSLTIDETAKTNFTVEGTSPDFILTQNGTGISAGAYPVTFTVKKGTEPVHIFTEYINVINGLCTDTWSGLEKGEAKVITQSAISSTVFVRGKDAPWYASNAPSAVASDGNSGTYLAPFATIQKAVDKIIAINDGTSEYTICVDGTLEYDESTYVGANGMADLSALTEKNLNLTIKALSGTATLDGGAVFNADGTVGTEGIKKRIIYAKPGTNGALNLTLDNLVITGGSSGGIGVYNCMFKMKDCEISRCTTTTGSGGGIYIYNNVSDASITCTITNCKISGCKSSGTTSTSGGGGIYVYSGALELTDVNIAGGNDPENPDANNGGGIYNNANGTLKMTGGSIIGCNAGATASRQGGGGIYNGGTFKLSGVTISGCSAGAFGGGILTRGTSTENLVKDCTITDCKISGTTANIVGGGIYVYSGSLTVEGGTISECVASRSGSGSGGGIFISSGASAEIKGCTITSCKAMNGGGINNQGTLTVTEQTSISDCNGGAAVYNWRTLTVTGGTKIFDCTNAGGIKNIEGDLTVDGCTISNCTYSDFGGIYIDDDSTSAKISNCTITDCHADTTATNVGNGGGINNKLASTEIEDCTITNCTAIHSGGGIYNNVSDDTVTTKITNCTISGCKAKGTTSTSGGGGIYVSSGALELTGVTITGGNDVENPDARLGGGIFVNGGMLTMTGGEISDCTATNSGGGVYIGSSGTFKMFGTAKITGCKTKSTTSSTGGGGIYSLGSLTVTGGTISDCIAGRSGGGIYAYGGTVECSGGVAFSNCETIGSGSLGSGGGICINSGVTVNVSDCTFTLCKAKASGGGIWNAGVLAVSNTPFTNCSAGSKGGGICNDGGTVTPTNITYSGCTAPTDSDKSGF